jgi:hypothetical protein
MIDREQEGYASSTLSGPTQNDWRILNFGASAADP